MEFAKEAGTNGPVSEACDPLLKSTHMIGDLLEVGVAAIFFPCFEVKQLVHAGDGVFDERTKDRFTPEVRTDQEVRIGQQLSCPTKFCQGVIGSREQAGQLPVDLQRGGKRVGEKCMVAAQCGQAASGRFRCKFTGIHLLCEQGDQLLMPTSISRE